jgi:serine/threonine-protein kinase/endoribonuclease IRE1
MSDERWSTARALIEKMISVEHTHRPTTTAVLRHPMFWPSEKVLNFLQDVSDRVDKESFDSAIVASLERNKLEVVRNNWYDLLDVQVNDAFVVVSNCFINTFNHGNKNYSA